MPSKDKVIKFIKLNISKISKSEYADKRKYEFLKSIDYDYYNLSHMDLTEIFKLYYSCFSKSSFDVIFNKFDFLEEYLNRIKPSDYNNLYDLYDFFIEVITTSDPEEYYIDKETYQNMLYKFNSLNFPVNLKKFFIDIFSDNREINFNAYNGFLNFCNTYNKITIVGSIASLIELATYEISNNVESSVKKRVDKLIKKEFPDLMNNINSMIKCKETLYNEYQKFEKNKIRKISILEAELEKVLDGKKVDIEKVKKYIDSNILIVVLLDYNNKFLVEEYESLLLENEQLRNNSVSTKEVLLKKLEFKLDISKILVTDDELEYKLKTINKYFPNAKKYNNIVLSLINKISIQNFELLKQLMNSNCFDQVFILDNINKLSNPDEFDNFIKNIELFNRIGFKVRDIVKFGNELVFLDNAIMCDRINNYLKYGVNFKNEISNYKFLYGNFTDIIDKFIEIGEYDFIINNPSLINSETDIIIKRCIFNKDINEPIFNAQGKLIGNLRKESSFYINDKVLNESLIENYGDLIPEDILDMMNSDLVSYEREIDELKKYKVNDFVYNINGFVVSINKVKRVIGTVLNSDIKDFYTFNELLFYAIIYKYPKLVTRNDIINLKNVLNIKTKTLN